LKVLVQAGTVQLVYPARQVRNALLIHAAVWDLDVSTVKWSECLLFISKQEPSIIQGLQLQRQNIHALPWP
jgi:hypothetical protein